MALNDILVLLDSDSRVIDGYAISLARTTGAHLTAVCAVFDPTPPLYAYPQPPYDIFSSLRENVEAAAQDKLASFARLALEAGVSAQGQTLELPLVDADRAFARVTSYFDLTIVEQANPDIPAARVGLIEAALVGSGRPLLIVPYIQRQPASLANILVAWDGSASAARAVGDSLPLLESAARIEVVTVGEPDALARIPPGFGLQRHLGRHRLNVQVRTLPSVNDVANTLLSHAADQGATLLVMGGYGHARLREIVLGGTTRGILASMTIPVLMAH